MCSLGCSFNRKKGCTINHVLQKNCNESDRKPNKRWVDKSSEFCNRLIKSWLQDNGIDMYSTYNAGKSVVVERFIRTLKNKIYKYFNSVSKNMYIDKLASIVNTKIHITEQ